MVSPKNETKKRWLNDKNFQNQKGLTLIELLAVILILGILAAITITVIAGQGEKARVQSYKDAIKAIESASGKYDLEEGFRTSKATDDYGIVDENHPMYVKGYLSELPKNPWRGTNTEQNDFVYIITKDVRDVKKAFLVKVNGSVVEKVLLIDEGEAKVFSVSESGLTFINDVSNFLSDSTHEDYLKYHYFNPK